MRIWDRGMRPYLLAVAAVACSSAARWALDPLVHDKAPLLPFACGVVVAALVGGFPAGVAATILSLPVCDYFFVQPRFTFFIHDSPAELAALALFLVLGIAVSVIVETVHRAQGSLRVAYRHQQQSQLRFQALAATMPEIVFTANPDGTRDYFNQGYYDYTGLDPDRAHAEWMNLVHPDDRGAVLDQWAESMRTGAEFSAAYRIRRADGTYRWFQGHAKPVREPGGAIVHWTGVAADIHAQKLLEEALARRTGQLVQSNEEFQKFAYRVAHDLKEPLRMIGIFTEMLVSRNRERLDDESRTFAGYVLDGVGRIQNQIRNLLQYASAGTFEIRTEPIDLNAVLESAIDNLRSGIIESGAAITHDELPRLVGNQERMRSVFQNLIGNALKYRGASPPRIHVTARVEDDQWIFSVRDNGIGFEMCEAERIFTAFERLENGANTQGSGLGLAIVKRIVELKGGRIWAESSPGAGSTFFFTLPRSLEARAAVARSQSAQATTASGAS